MNASRSSARPRRYPLEQSPLYSMRGKNQFERTLRLDWDAVPRLLERRLYRVWTNDKGRPMQTPVGWLRDVHGRIGALLSRVELPDYAFPQKGRSYVDNARRHVGPHPVIKADIAQFYPSVSRNRVLRMFLNEFNCAQDISNALADICCYQGQFLPTGSPLSGYVAFFSARQLFDDINRLSAERGCVFTVYVDDITVSGPNANKRLLGEILRLVVGHGLQTKRKKSKSFAASTAKTITGAVVTETELRLPDARHVEIRDAYRELSRVTGGERDALIRKLEGRLAQSRQVQGIRGTTNSLVDPTIDACRPAG